MFLCLNPALFTSLGGYCIYSLGYFPLRAAVCAGYAFAVVAQKNVILYCSRNRSNFSLDLQRPSYNKAAKQCAHLHLY